METKWERDLTSVWDEQHSVTMTRGQWIDVCCSLWDSIRLDETEEISERIRANRSDRKVALRDIIRGVIGEEY